MDSNSALKTGAQVDYALYTSERAFRSTILENPDKSGTCKRKSPGQLGESTSYPASATKTFTFTRSISNLFSSDECTTQPLWTVFHMDAVNGNGQGVREEHRIRVSFLGALGANARDGPNVNPTR